MPPKSKNSSPPAATAEKASGTQSIQRAIDILHEIASNTATDGLRIADLCARMGLERPTVHRIVTCLQENRMLMRAPGSRSFRLGPAVFHLGLAASQDFSLNHVCAPALDVIANKTGNAVFLTIRSGNDSVTIDRRIGSFPIQVLSLEVGARRPLGIGAGSLAILATLPEAETEAIIAANLPRLRTYTDLDQPMLTSIIQQARETGYAMNEGHATAEVSAIGISLRNALGAPLAAITVAALSSRMTPEHIDLCVNLMRDQVRQLESVVSLTR
jgi:DNA-binding IclR family transcriptional regulator